MSCFSEQVPEWVQEVRLSQQEGKEANADQELKLIKGINKTVIDNLNPESVYLHEAINSSSIIHDKNFVEPLLKVAQSEKVDLLQRSMAISVINQLSTADQLKLVLTTYSKICPFDKPVSAVLKLACLNIYDRFPSELKGRDLVILLDDESYELRIEVINKVSLLKDPKMKEQILGKSLGSSPYQLRLRSIDEIKKLPTDQRLNLKVMLEKCKSDSNDLVREACRKI
jgi:hypothetical protein